MEIIIRWYAFYGLIPYQSCMYGDYNTRTYFRRQSEREWTIVYYRIAKALLELSMYILISHYTVQHFLSQMDQLLLTAVVRGLENF